MTEKVIAKDIESRLDDPHSLLWRNVSVLREYVDAWDFKQFVFAILVYKFMSDRQCAYVNELVNASNALNIDFATLNDEEAIEWREIIVKGRGYYIPPSELFGKVYETFKGNANLDVKLTEILGNIEASSRNSAGERLIDGLFEYVNFNSILLAESSAKRSRKLEQLMKTISDITSLSSNCTCKSLYGNIFEEFMNKCGENSGQYGESYSTPPKLAELLVRIATHAKRRIRRVYDPACGTGSLLTKFSEAIECKSIQRNLFGQEIDKSTYNLCRMNLLLHGLEDRNIDIELGNTLLNPKFDNSQPFDAIASNLPKSITWNGDNSNLQNDRRFAPAGVLAPKYRADLAFVMHTLSMLSDTGTAAISLLPVVLWKGGSERQIRKYLIDNNFIDGVIQLPKSVWFNDRLPICVLVLKKNRSNNKVVFLDARNVIDRVSTNCETNSEFVNAIVDDYHNRQPSDGAIKKIDSSEIAENLYDLVPGSYISGQEHHESIDIETINGNLKRYTRIGENCKSSLEKKIENIKVALQ